MTVKKLVEKSTATIAARDSGGDRYRMRVISAGNGSSANYPAAVLERDLAAAFPAGTRMRGNHDGWFADGGDVMRLMGKTLTAAEWDAEEQAGFADFQVAPQFNEWFLTFADVIGVSVQALAEAQWPDEDPDLELDGPILPVITRLLPASEAPYNSIDIVEAPGANGRIVQALESLRTIAHEAFGITETSRLDAVIREHRGTPEQPVTEKGTTMDEETLARLIAEAVAKAVPGAVTEALKPAEPKDEKPAMSAVAEAIVTAKLSDEGRAAVYEALEAGKPLEATIAREQARETKMREAIKAELVAEQQNDVQRGFVTTEGAATDTFGTEFDDVFTRLEESAGRPVAQKVGA